MNLEEFLEKYNCTMNPEQINNITDNNIINIKHKYWNLYHKAFLDEHNIPDAELKNVFDKLKLEERKELEEYYKTLNLK